LTHLKLKLKQKDHQIYSLSFPQCNVAPDDKCHEWITMRTFFRAEELNFNRFSFFFSMSLLYWIYRGPFYVFLLVDRSSSLVYVLLFCISCSAGWPTMWCKQNLCRKLHNSGRLKLHM
jgi:hypothetical protein